MSNITKERVAQIIHAAGLEPCDYEAVFDSIKTGEIVAMARIALSSLEAEPVAYTEKCEITNMQATGLYLRGFPDNSQGRDIALYTAPPAPVSVPDEATPENIEILASTFAPRGVTYQWDRDECNAAADSWNACRAAMLQGAEPVTTAISCTK